MNRPADRSDSPTWRRRVSRAIFWLIAAFYAYGAFVHVTNMLGFRGSAWLDWPLKWQVLDVFYLVLDLVVAIGFVRAWRIALFTFFVAAVSQIALYTVFRAWIIDVPIEIAPNSNEVAYLNWLVGFHLVSIVLVVLALWLMRAPRRSSRLART